MRKIYQLLSINYQLRNIRLYLLNNKNSSGFTLIELLISFSVVTILSTIGIATFVNYSRTQALRTSSSEFAASLVLARSRALAQVKPSQCGSQVLDGYQVAICASGSSCTSNIANFEVHALCDGNIYVLQAKTFPANISFADNLGSTFFFPVLRSTAVGAAASGTSVTISGYGNTAIVKIYQDGRISQQ